MSVTWMRIHAPRAAAASAIAVLCLSAAPEALHADNACEDEAGNVVTTCPEWLSMHRNVLLQRKNRAVALRPEESQVSGRISGRAWNPWASGSMPASVTAAGDALQMQTSLSQLGAYFSRLDAERINEVKAETEEDDEPKLPDPVSARSKKVDVWSSTKFEGLDDNAFRQGVISHVGADYTVSDDFVLGASAEFEDLEQETGIGEGATAAGKAYMVGPYMARRLVDNLVLDARLGWGRSSDALDAGEAEDRFAAERSLAKARLTGDFLFEDWRISSTAAFIYATEVPAGGPGDGVVTNQVSLGPEMRRSVKLESGEVIEPFFHYRNTVDMHAMEGLSELDALTFSGSLGGGVNVTKPEEYAVRATTVFEGVDGEGDPNVTSRIQMTLPLN